MSFKIKSLLLPFYFGSIPDSDRILVERELLTDSEILMDYFDLKRSLEKAEALPMAPSIAVWNSLRKKVIQRKKLFLTLSFGAVATIVIWISVILFKNDWKVERDPVPSSEEVLFDSHGEPSSLLNVL